jgi:hypothetical protein
MIDLSFSREYINDRKERTSERKQKIRQAYKELTGKDINGRCSTCYIEALLKILKLTPQIPKEMAAKNYELKKGVQVLQCFGHPEKSCTRDTMTDELAEWHLAQHPGKAIFFARMPEAPKPLPIIKIITPIVKEVKPDNPVEILGGTLKAIQPEPIKEVTRTLPKPELKTVVKKKPFKAKK